MKHQKPFTAKKVKHEFAETLVTIIDKAFQTIEPANDDDRLFLAALAEVRLRILQRMLTPRSEYQFQFSPVQAVAIRILHTDVITTPPTDYCGNQLRQLADGIHKHYF
jgi:hypothetical protein